jgi:hypothetical protein
LLLPLVEKGALMKKLVIALAALTLACMATVFAQTPPDSSLKTVAWPHKENLPDLTLNVKEEVSRADFDVKLIDVTDHVPNTVKVHPGDEVVVGQDPRDNSCCGDSSKTIEDVHVTAQNPDTEGPPVLALSPDVGAPIVRAFIGNNKGTAKLTIEITCRDSSGHRVVQTKTVVVVVH